MPTMYDEPYNIIRYSHIKWVKQHVTALVVHILTVPIVSVHWVRYYILSSLIVLW